jgi:hypothetical protein
MMKLVAIAAVPAALAAGAASLGVMVVDVREGGPDGHHILVPVPLVLAEAGLAFVPANKTTVPREAMKHLPVAREVMEALLSGPDGEFVRVEEDRQTVVISKKNGKLHVHVTEEGQDVTLNLPAAMIRAAMPDDQGRISPAGIAASLWSARFTDLVDVDDGRDHVSIAVF